MKSSSICESSNPDPGRAATIKDVARLASVSIATVSGVLNGVAKCTEQTKTAVRRAVELCDYHPNLHARYLSKLRRGK